MFNVPAILTTMSLVSDAVQFATDDYPLRTEIHTHGFGLADYARRLAATTHPQPDLVHIYAHDRRTWPLAALDHFGACMEFNTHALESKD